MNYILYTVATLILVGGIVEIVRGIHLRNEATPPWQQVKNLSQALSYKWRGPMMQRGTTKIFGGALLAVIGVFLILFTLFAHL